VGISSVRGVILAAAVLLGVLGIAKAFPSNASRSVAPPGGTGGGTHPSSTPSTPIKTLPATHSPSRKSLTKGVSVQILNGSGKTGIAASTTDTLKGKKLGFDVQDPGNYPPPHLAVTTIFYKQGFKDSATYLAEKMFTSAAIKLSKNAGFTADITVVLGTDFSA
jgi:hypothetical protein